MIRWSRRLLEAVEAIADRLGSTQVDRDALVAVAARVDELERRRGLFEAEMESLLVKVETRERAARARENSARHIERRLKRGADEGDQGSEEDAGFGIVPAADGAGSEESEVQPVRASVGARGTSRRAAALAAKWGR